jgi:LmbE family N-acetylglucosaminyl deacetylase
MNTKAQKQVAVVVAHPDDETLWAGGTLLSHPEWNCFIACLCRKDDPDRALKFARVLDLLGAKGTMGTLDDGPEQQPLPEKKVQNMILQLLPGRCFDLVLTHSIYGEYTRHRRHEETGRAVISLWADGMLTTAECWTFAYEDGHKTYYPRAMPGADHYEVLPEKIWKQKYQLMTGIYGFAPDSWEAGTTPTAEAFLQFTTADDARQWLFREGAES